MKKITRIEKFVCWALFLLLLFVGLVVSPTGSAAADLSKKIANDPVTKALGPEIMKAAVKEGKVVWYGGSFLRKFKKPKKAFEKRFGIRLEPVAGRLRELAERVRAEHATGNKVCDTVAFVDQYLFELHEMNALEKFKPPAPTLAGYDKAKKMFHPKYEEYWSPLHVSAQALIANTDKLKKEEYPKSYWDIVDPKWKGKVAIRDPRSSGGGAWQFLHLYDNPDLGLNYIKKLKEVVDPFIVRGGSRKIRDAIVTGQFALGFSGRPEFLIEVPKGSPLELIVPKEGFCYTAASMSIIKGAPHPNAAKVFMTWMYELENLQAYADARLRPVPHSDIKMKIPQMVISNYPVMDPIPSEHLAKPGFFFDEMEKIFK